MDNYLMDLWEKTLDLVKNEITDVSFDTWIKAIEPVSIREISFIFVFPMTLPRAFWKEGTPV